MLPLPDKILSVRMTRFLEISLPDLWTFPRFSDALPRREVSLKRWEIRRSARKYKG